jgi:tRNA 2-selenouridine synthase SelU
MPLSVKYCLVVRRSNSEYFRTLLLKDTPLLDMRAPVELKYCQNR